MHEVISTEKSKWVLFSESKQLKIMSTVVGKLLNNNSLNLIPEFSNKLDYTFKHDKDNISLVIPISKIRQFIQGESVILSLQVNLFILIFIYSLQLMQLLIFTVDSQSWSSNIAIQERIQSDFEENSE